MQNTTKREIVEIITVIVAVVISILLILFSAPKKGDVIVINCTWSEISPDFSNEIKELCRKARMENIK